MTNTRTDRQTDHDFPVAVGRMPHASVLCERCGSDAAWPSEVVVGTCSGVEAGGAETDDELLMTQ